MNEDAKIERTLSSAIAKVELAHARSTTTRLQEAIDRMAKDLLRMHEETAIDLDTWPAAQEIVLSASWITRGYYD
jgi:hypothetical protein